MLPRKYASGSQKRNKRKRIDEVIKTQRGALHKFLIPSSSSSMKEVEVIENEEVDALNEVEVGNDIENEEIDLDEDEDDALNEEIDDLRKKNDSLNIFDPRTWTNLDNKTRDILIEKGPLREYNLTFPIDELGRHFAYSYYTRKLPNGENQDRKWLVYSKDANKVYCFCCKLFRSLQNDSLLANEGLNDWKHINDRLKKHENSIEHINNMRTWIDLHIRLQHNQTIDKDLQELIKKEKEHWKLVLVRIIAIGNAYIDYTDRWSGTYDHFWSSALISDETHQGILENCNFSSDMSVTEVCEDYQDKAFEESGNIDIYDIYAALCDSNSTAYQISTYDPCSSVYATAYLNTPQVQKALHANTTGLPVPWQGCNDPIRYHWQDEPLTVLPVIKKLMASGIRVWIYSGDTDGIIPVTSTRYSMPKLGAPVKTPWYPWDFQGEVGGYVVGYENVTFVTIRGAGHFVPSYQPQRALAFFSNFIEGKLPPPQKN